MRKSLSASRNWPPTLCAAGAPWGASELGSNTGHSSEKYWGIFGWSAKYPADSSELPAAQSALWFCLKDPSPCKCDFSVHNQKHLLEFQGAFSLMQSIHFYMMQHKTNFLAFALCCVKGTLMEMMHQNPKCWKSLNQLLPNPARTTPQAVQETVGEPGIQRPTSYLITI